jgi:hypothetical protein
MNSSTSLTLRRWSNGSSIRRRSVNSLVKQTSPNVRVFRRGVEEGMENEQVYELSVRHNQQKAGGRDDEEENGKAY